MRGRPPKPVLPSRGDKLFKDGQEVGYITNAVKSRAAQGNVALGYVRREANVTGAKLMLHIANKERAAVVCQVG